jgi:hypothetical protein
VGSRKEIDKIYKALRKAENEIKSRSNMKAIAQVSAEMIKDRTRFKSKGVEYRDGPEHKLARLELSTIKARRRKKLHSSTTPEKSNLTESGQLLDALYGKGIKKGVGIVGIKSSRKKSELTNDEVAFFVSGKRPFIDLSKKEITKLIKITDKKTNVLFEKHLRNL